MCMYYGGQSNTTNAFVNISLLLFRNSRQINTYILPVIYLDRIYYQNQEYCIILQTRGAENLSRFSSGEGEEKVGVLYLACQ